MCAGKHASLGICVRETRIPVTTGRAWFLRIASVRERLYACVRPRGY